jgi:TetR/AcrR family transcriptional repressor of nem operon
LDRDVLAALLFAVPGVALIAGFEHFVSRMTSLGYPDYFGELLGVSKLAAVATILAPGFPRLKEWTYTAMVIDVASAVASRAIVQGAGPLLAVPICIGLLVLTWWALRPMGRRLRPPLDEWLGSTTQSKDRPMTKPERKKITKRRKLVDAAVTLAYRQGYRKTTLSDIATESGVPLGNVYYYFKSRDEIGAAILVRREGDFAELRADLDTLTDPRDRLIGFVERTINNAGSVAAFGCPMGSLCAELLKEGGSLATRSNALFAEPMAYMAVQFRALGYDGAADDLALQLQSALQGASLIAQSFRDPDLLIREGTRLKVWLVDL